MRRLSFDSLKKLDVSVRPLSTSHIRVYAHLPRRDRPLLEQETVWRSNFVCPQQVPHAGRHYVPDNLHLRCTIRYSTYLGCAVLLIAHPFTEIWCSYHALSGGITQNEVSCTASIIALQVVYSSHYLVWASTYHLLVHAISIR